MQLRLPSQQFNEWRKNARIALENGVPPERFDHELPGMVPGDLALAVPSAMVPRQFLKFAKRVAMHNSEEKWRLLYSLLWRIHHGEADLMKNLNDPEVARAIFMFKAVGRDLMKMKVFVKFRDSHGLKVAWYKPDHHIEEELARFFVKRVPDSVWLLHTPHLTVRWNKKEVEYSAGMAQPPRFMTDNHEEVWQRYYHAQFNPWREKIVAGRAR
jgi:uracil-DNA glycosylase